MTSKARWSARSATATSFFSQARKPSGGAVAEPFHRYAPALVRPHRRRASPPQRGRAAGIGPSVDLKDGLRTLTRIGHEALGLAQLLRGQAAEHAAKLGWIEAGHGGSPRASETSAYLIDALKQSANQHDLLTPLSIPC